MFLLVISLRTVSSYFLSVAIWAQAKSRDFIFRVLQKNTSRRVMLAIWWGLFLVVSESSWALRVDHYSNHVVHLELPDVDLISADFDLISTELDGAIMNLDLDVSSLMQCTVSESPTDRQRSRSPSARAAGTPPGPPPGHEAGTPPGPPLTSSHEAGTPSGPPPAATSSHEPMTPPGPPQAATSSLAASASQSQHEDGVEDDGSSSPSFWTMAGRGPFEPAPMFEEGVTRKGHHQFLCWCHLMASLAGKHFLSTASQISMKPDFASSIGCGNTSV